METKVVKQMNYEPPMAELCQLVLEDGIAVNVWLMSIEYDGMDGVRTVNTF